LNASRPSASICTAALEPSSPFSGPAWPRRATSSCGAFIVTIFVVATAFLAGCSSAPNQANIALRKENQKLSAQIADLQRRNACLEAQIRVVQASSASTVQSLPEDRLEQLFTTHGLSLGDDGLRVYAVPVDGQGQPLKAAGTFRVELFDLDQASTRLGTWDFSLEQSRNDWLGSLWFYTYQLPCPWQKMPRHAKLLVHVTFTDALTGRVFTADKDITVKLPIGQPE